MGWAAAVGARGVRQRALGGQRVNTHGPSPRLTKQTRRSRGRTCCTRPSPAARCPCCGAPGTPARQAGRRQRRALGRRQLPVCLSHSVPLSCCPCCALTSALSFWRHTCSRARQPVQVRAANVSHCRRRRPLRHTAATQAPASVAHLLAGGLVQLGVAHGPHGEGGEAGLSPTRSAGAVVHQTRTCSRQLHDGERSSQLPTVGAPSSGCPHDCRPPGGRRAALRAPGPPN